MPAREEDVRRQSSMEKEPKELDEMPRSGAADTCTHMEAWDLQARQPHPYGGTFASFSWEAGREKGCGIPG